MADSATPSLLYSHIQPHMISSERAFNHTHELQLTQSGREALY